MTKNAPLISPSGTLRTGFFETAVGAINYRDFPLRSPFRELLPTDQREKRFVHFHFLGFASDRFIAGCSLARANEQTTVFFYLFDRSTGQMIKKGCRARAEDKVDLGLDPDNAVTRISGKGLDVIFDNSLSSMTKELRITLDSSPLLEMRFSETETVFETLRLCTPTGPNGWTYCQKVAGIPASGTLYYEGQSFDLKELGAFAHHDFTAGHLRQDTFWNWACITGEDSNGMAIGLNLSNGVNETGYSENALWIDGKREACGLMQFQYDQDNLESSWKITSDTGLLDLTFTPEGCYAATDKKSSTPFDFHQLFGSFSGEITTTSGNCLKIERLAGFCERQYAVWWD